MVAGCCRIRAHSACGCTIASAVLSWCCAIAGQRRPSWRRPSATAPPITAPRRVSSKSIASAGTGTWSMSRNGTPRPSAATPNAPSISFSACRSVSAGGEGRRAFRRHARSRAKDHRLVCSAAFASTPAQGGMVRRGRRVRCAARGAKALQAYFSAFEAKTWPDFRHALKPAQAVFDLWGKSYHYLVLRRAAHTPRRRRPRAAR